MLYHLKPRKMRGEKLYPLNQLRIVAPDIYEQEELKYRDYARLREVFIPPLACYWGDVIFMVAVPPSEIKGAYIEAGGSEGLTLHYYAIDVATLDLKALAVLMMDEEGVSSESEFLRRMEQGEGFAAYEDMLWKSYSTLPANTVRYYSDMFACGQTPQIYRTVPHVFYKGTIPVGHARNIIV